ncbi:MAG: hypothetical protein M1820_006071 [Bogoriella megaspora]|nr:MAG: hypothetical protein M1820_006071 [Bogoriella megaspora]
MEEAKIQADEVRTALSSSSTCNSATISTLRQLFDAQPPSKENINHGHDGKSSRVTNPANPSRSRAPGRNGTQNAPKASANGLTKAKMERSNTPLNTRERYVLAQDTINTALKFLTEELKNQPKTRASISPNKTFRQRKLSNTPSNNTRILQHRGAGKSSSGSKTLTDLPRSASTASISSQDSKTGVVAVAECARVAFAYLRSARNGESSVKNLPNLQLEHGMLAFVGKLVHLGLDTMAINELCVLKRRLNQFMNTERCSKGGNASQVCDVNSSKDRETLASLLNFDQIFPESTFLPLVASHQLLVLRLIASARRASVIEAAIEHLLPTSPSCPEEVLKLCAKEHGHLEKATRQMQSLNQLLLSLCPSSSGTEDSAAGNTKLYPTPETTFKLQQLGLRARIQWWSLAGHQGNIEKELVEPLTKCMNAFIRRSRIGAKEVYESTTAVVANLCEDLKGSVSETLSSDLANTRRTSSWAALEALLSSVAQEAGAIDQAMQHATDAFAIYSNEAPVTELYLLKVRLALLVLEQGPAGSSTDANSDYVADVLDILKTCAGGVLSPKEIARLLPPVVNIRKSAFKHLIASQGTQSDSPSRSELPSTGHPVHEILFACLHFLAKFMDILMCEDSDIRPDPEIGSFRSLAVQVTRGTVESALVAVKTQIRSRAIEWNDLDDVLQACLKIITHVEVWSQDGKVGLPADFVPGSFVVKISNLYWTNQFDQTKTSNSETSIDTIQAMTRSVDCMRSRSDHEQQSGSLHLKLEKLASTLEQCGQRSESRKSLIDALQMYIRRGILKRVARLAGAKPLKRVWMADAQSIQFRKMLAALIKGLWSTDSSSAESLHVFDDRASEVDERATLLEQQLCLLMGHVVSGRSPTQLAQEALRSITTRLFEIYTLEKYPVRRQRVAELVLKLATEHPGLLDADTICLAEDAQLSSSDRILNADDGLSPYSKYVNASWLIACAFRNGLPPIQKIEPALSCWRRIVDLSKSWEEVLGKIDDPEAWVAQVQMVVNFLDMQGLQMQKLALLKMVAKMDRMRECSNIPSTHLSDVQVMLQYTRLGYTGQAGLLLPLDSLALSSEPVENVLQGHLAKAEYFVSIGDISSSRDVLQHAASFATQSSDIHCLTKPSASSSSRVRYYKLVADTASIMSSIALETGALEEAFVQAKRCLRLHQRIWAILENRNVTKKSTTTGKNGDLEMEHITQGLSNSYLDSKGPIPVISMTHESLRGPIFWPYVQSMLRAFAHLAKLYTHVGLLQESVYYNEQAKKIGDAVNAQPLLLEIEAKMALSWIEGGHVGEAKEILDKLGVVDVPECQATATASYAFSRLSYLQGDDSSAMKHMDDAIATLQALLKSPDMDAAQLHNKAGLNAGMDRLEVQPAPKPKASVKSARSKKGVARPVTKPCKFVAVNPPTDEVDPIFGCPRLAESLSNVLVTKAVALLMKDLLSEASDILADAGKLLDDTQDSVSFQWAMFKSFFAQASMEIASDITFNVLPESTISFPALSRQVDDAGEILGLRQVYLSPAKKQPSRSVSPRKGGRKPTALENNFRTLLQQARDCVFKVQSRALTRCGSSTIHNVYNVLGQITVLLSATDQKLINSTLTPLAAAYSLELPRDYAFQSDITAISVEKKQSKAKDISSWPNVDDVLLNQARLATTSQFQQKYIEVIPEDWTTISLSLNENCDELFVTRYEVHQDPFILRLPIIRHKTDEMDDDDPFTFEQGKKELLEIIRLSNESTRDTRDMSIKGAKTAWWEERKVLDARLKELLVNIETIWFGGFRGILSQHQQHPHLMARFHKTFTNILNRHLPSRQGTGRKQVKSKSKSQNKSSKSEQIELDPRVLELFIGLGNTTHEDLDVDEALTDLVYFIVDILQFNGERNAYDEIDFDAIVIETIDALNAYHEAARHEKTTPNTRHVILILDKQLHAFPWESLPCLDGLAISRVPSMKALHDRIIVQRRQQQQQQLNLSLALKEDSKPLDPHDPQPQDHSLARRALTSYILNPSRDLTHTEKILTPPLHTLPPNPQCPIPQLIARAPSETDFETMLTHSDILLYFGHGSGAQYIRTRSIKKLDRCARVVWLMGCSSGAVVENGAYEPQGAVLGYLVAGWSDGGGRLYDIERGVDDYGDDGDVDEGMGREGEGEDVEDVSPCMAVCATLWDVTDKDIDRFSVRLGEEWGLWERERVGKDKWKMAVERGVGDGDNGRKGTSLSEAVAKSRGECYLRYLNGAAAVVYGVPVWLG